MSETRSSTLGGTVIPTLRYRDAQRAIDWLCEAFGFERNLVVPGENGDIAHAQLVLDTGMIMLGSARDDAYGRLVPSGVGSCYVIVADVDRHHDRAVRAGAEIVMPLTDQDYGSREYTCRDLEGNVWSFGTYDPWKS